MEKSMKTLMQQKTITEAKCYGACISLCIMAFFHSLLIQCVQKFYHQNFISFFFLPDTANNK